MDERGGPPQGDIVLGTRCRLARNLEGLPFPGAAEREQLKQILSRVQSMLPALAEFGGDFDYQEMAIMDSLQREILVEEHLISRAMHSKPAA